MKNEQHPPQQNQNQNPTKPQPPQQYRYTCIHCLQPTPILYRQYSTKYNIKLQQCTSTSTTKTSISSCSKDVDPYIEYELLLVCMDMILFRKNAFRHFLFNRSLLIGGNCGNNMDMDYNDNITHTSGTSKQEKEEEESNECFEFICSWGNHIGYHGSYYINVMIVIIGIVGLQTILKIQGLDEETGIISTTTTIPPLLPETTNTICEWDDTSELHLQQNTMNQSMITSCNGGDGTLPIQHVLSLYLMIGFMCLLEYIVLYIGTLMSTLFIHKIASTTSTTITTSSSSSILSSSISYTSSISRQLYLAIFIPQLFNIITLLVHIYENSPIVRIIGSILIFGFNFMAVHCIIERLLVQNKNSTASTATAGKTKTSGDDSTLGKRFISSITEMIPGWPFLFGYILKLIVRHIILVRLLILLLDNEIFANWNVTNDTTTYYGLLFQLNDEESTREMVIGFFNQMFTID